MHLLPSPSIKPYVAIILFILLAIASISSHSLWIDEGVRLMYANISIEDGWFQHQWGIMQVGLANLQYAWGSIFGTSEIAYRCLNLPFLFIAGIYTCCSLKKLSLSPYWALLLVMHPMPLYYMNDAGPYIPLLASSCALYYHCFLATNRYSWVNLLCLFTWFLFGYLVHFIFGFFGFVYACSALWAVFAHKSWRSAGREILIACLFAPLFLYVTHQYMQIMINGSERGWSHPGVFNIGYALYCFAGMAGLGLPRNDLRQGSLHLLTPEMIILIGICTLTLASLLILHLKKSFRFLASPTSISAGAGLLIFLICTYIQNFQFWERHLIFVFPICLYLLAMLLQTAWSHQRKYVNRLLCVILIGFWLLSSFNLRYAEQYRKDDYKGTFTHLKEKGYLDGRIPVLAQGSIFLFDYYNIKRSYTPFSAPLKDTVIHIDQLKEEQIIQLSHAMLDYYPRICLVLHEKNEQTRQLYKGADFIFSNMRYQVTLCDEYNTFKVITIQKPLF